MLKIDGALTIAQLAEQTGAPSAMDRIIIKLRELQVLTRKGGKVREMDNPIKK